MAESYWYDEKEAQRAAEFFPLFLTHVKGELAGQPFVLQPWQDFVVRELFGWKRKDGSRRYRKAYIEVPRKNGKSVYAAGIALYLFLCDKELGGEIYSAAGTIDQASLVFSMAASMVRQSASMSKQLQVRDSTKRMLYPARNSIYRAISADAANAHGFNAHGIIFDELHTQPTRELWDVLDTSTGARRQPLTVAITTAGHDRSSICWEMHQYAIGVRDGLIDDPAFYPVLYSAPPDADWRDEAVWAQANPCLGVSLTLDYLREQCKRAMEQPSFENTFRRLHLNQWTEQEARVIPMIQWDACQQEVSEPAYYGRRCFAGLDLSSTKDATALALLFPEEDGAVTVLPYFWIPEENVNSRAASDQRMLKNFAAQGFVEMTPGNEVDVIFLADRVAEICQQFDLAYMGFDPWNATGVVQLLQERGLSSQQLLKMPQSYSTYNEPFKRMLSCLSSGKLRQNGNPVLRWMAGNVAAKEDPNGNIRPDKGKSADKIDGICAMLMALGLSIHYGGDSGAYDHANSGVVIF